MPWKSVCVQPSTSIAETIRKIDESSLQIALVVDAQGRLLGTVTDGDVRRGIVKGAALNDAVSTVMNSSPTTAAPGDGKEAILAVMRARQFRHMPLVDKGGCLVGLEVLDDLLRPQRSDNPVVLMAGGLGKRLGELTAQRPKPMLNVGDRPILETILLNFMEHGFHRFYIAVNHCAEVITEYFGDGSRWGCEIEYLCEKRRLGTAGALSLLPEKPALPFFVMNGDVLTKVNLSHLLQFHLEQQATATMCVREYEMQVPFGVIRMNGHEIMSIDEKPKHQFFVNAGIYVLDPAALGFVPKNAMFDMTTLFETVIRAQHKTAVFPVREYWVDIGRHADFERAQDEFRRVFAASAGAGTGEHAN